ncbi:hypothetical protein HMPREF9622_00786 [Cutibacterium modestum HL037PA3]|nr:hypothetical protein HMPREF9622_00786 [Cutibacterium modestum HL037PA3]
MGATSNTRCASDGVPRPGTWKTSMVHAARRRYVGFLAELDADTLDRYRPSTLGLQAPCVRRADHLSYARSVGD